MKKTDFSPHRSSLGLDANLTVLIAFLAMAALAWLPYVRYGAWAAPLVFFFLEKESKFVKFQTVQILIIGIAQAALNILFDIIYWALMPKDIWGALTMAFGGRTGAMTAVWMIQLVVNAGISVLVLYLLVMAWSYKQVELPVLGPIAAKAADKLNTININQTQNARPAAAPGDIFCSSCGAPNPAGTKFCSACGKSVE